MGARIPQMSVTKSADSVTQVSRDRHSQNPAAWKQSGFSRSGAVYTPMLAYTRSRPYRKRSTVFALLTEAASAEDIPYQVSVYATATPTDAAPARSTSARRFAPP